MFYLEKIYNLNQDDENFLQDLIDNKIMESLNLEYKRELPAPKNNIDLAKEVSSFANSNGGIIIYGIEEKNHFPEKLNPLDSNLKERIENIILTSISPKISTKIITIDSENNPGKKYYVIYISKSSDAPFMLISNQDNRYYKRVNFSSIPMEDYEVRLILEKNLKSKKEIFSEIEQRVVLFYEDRADQDMNGEYLRFVFKINDCISLQDINSNKFKNKKFYMNNLFNNHDFINCGKGKIIEYGIYDKSPNIDDYMKNYLLINEDGYMEYVKLGIIKENTYFKAKELYPLDILTDLMGFIYFLKDFCKEFKIINETFFYIEIYNIKNTILSSSNSIRFTGGHKQSLIDKWTDYKYIQAYELMSDCNSIIKNFADRIYENYGYKDCPNLVEDNGELKILFKQ